MARLNRSPGRGNDSVGLAATILSGAQSAFACCGAAGDPRLLVSDADVIVKARVGGRPMVPVARAGQTPRHAGSYFNTSPGAPASTTTPRSKTTTTDPRTGALRLDRGSHRESV